MVEKEQYSVDHPGGKVADYATRHEVSCVCKKHLLQESTFAGEKTRDWEGGSLWVQKWDIDTLLPLWCMEKLTSESNHMSQQESSIL